MSELERLQEQKLEIEERIAELDRSERAAPPSPPGHPHPGGDRVSFQSDVEARQESLFVNAIMGQIGIAHSLVGKTIQNVLVSDDLGWRQRQVEISLRGGGSLTIRGTDLEVLSE